MTILEAVDCIKRRQWYNKYKLNIISIEVLDYHITVYMKYIQLYMAVHRSVAIAEDDYMYYRVFIKENFHVLGKSRAIIVIAE